jgi:hypothetical protein
MDDGEPVAGQRGAPPPAGIDDAVAELAGDLARWAAEAREREAAASRTRRRWLEQQAAEEVTFVAVLLGVGEARTPVVLGVAGGDPLRGVVAAVGRDFCAVQTAARGTVLVRLADVTDVRIQPGYGEVVGTHGDPSPAAMSLADVLFGLSGERPGVVVGLRRGGGLLAGELRAVGIDVATIRTPGDPPVTVYVPLDAISQVSLRR